MKMVVVKKNPTKAAMLGIFPGLGFLYLGNVKKFGTFFFVTMLALIMGLVSNKALLFGALLMWGLGMATAYSEANERIYEGKNVRVDPSFALCLSFLWDGLGQFFVRKKTMGLVMFLTGFTPCLIGWVVCILKFGVNDMATVMDGAVFTATNFMILWTIYAIPVKIMSMIDSYYSCYHLYVAKIK